MERADRSKLGPDLWSARANHSRREFLSRNAMAAGALLASGSVAGLLAACGSDDDGGGDGGGGVTASDVAQATGTIKVYGWSSLEASAQNAGGVKGKWTPIAGDAAQIPIKIKPAGSFDVFTSTASQMEQYFAVDRLVPIDTSLLSNYDGLDKGLREDDVWKGPDGEVYAVPLVLGVAITAWDKSKVAEPRSIEDFLKPEYQGAIGLYDDYQMINTIAQGLGLPQPPELTSSHLDQISDYLEQLRPQVKTFYPYGGEVQLFGRGDIAVAYTTFGSVALDAKESNRNVETNLVSSVSYADALSVLAGDKEVESLAWIDQAISREAMTEMGESSTSVTARPDVPVPGRGDVTVSEVFEESPVVGPYPLESDGDKVTVDQATSLWNEYKASFA